MNKIDESMAFKPVNIAVLTVSDTRTPSCFQSVMRNYLAQRPRGGKAAAL